jgi:hypothetical protein
LSIYCFYKDLDFLENIISARDIFYKSSSFNSGIKEVINKINIFFFYILKIIVIENKSSFIYNNKIKFEIDIFAFFFRDCYQVIE